MKTKKRVLNRPNESTSCLSYEYIDVRLLGVSGLCLKLIKFRRKLLRKL